MHQLIIFLDENVKHINWEYYENLVNGMPEKYQGRKKFDLNTIELKNPRPALANRDVTELYESLCRNENLFFKNVRFLVIFILYKKGNSFIRFIYLSTIKVGEIVSVN